MLSREIEGKFPDSINNNNNKQTNKPTNKTGQREACSNPQNIIYTTLWDLPFVNSHRKPTSNSHHHHHHLSHSLSLSLYLSLSLLLLLLLQILNHPHFSSHTIEDGYCCSGYFPKPQSLPHTTHPKR